MKPDNGHLDLERLGSSDAPELHRALDAVKQRLPDPQQLAALAASLSQLGISVAPSGQPTAATASSATRFKLLLGAGVVGPVALALLLWRSAPPPMTAPTAGAFAATSTAPALAPTTGSSQGTSLGSKEVTRLSASSVVTDPAPSDAPSPSAIASVAAGADNGAQTATSAGPVKSAPRVGVAPTASTQGDHSPLAPSTAKSATPESIGPSVVSRPTEVALLRDARLALNGNPTEALALAERHRTLYPHGAMIQERELIAISALARLGRHSAVLARAGQFEHDFPNSPYRKQVTALAQ